MYIRTLWSRVRNVSTKLLDVIALPTEGIEPGFNRMPMIPGVHLRWSFRADLGFPANGFQIHRRLYRYPGGDIPTPPVPGEWELIHTVLPPASLVATTGLSDSVIAARVLEHLKSVQLDAAVSLYRTQAQDLVRILRDLENVAGDVPIHQRRLAPDSGGSPFRIRTMDALFLASLDPFIARMLGLYWIDGAVPPGRRADYRVVGLWGATPFPVNDVDFRRAARRGVASGSLELDAGVDLFSERSLTLDDAGTLHAVGAPGLELRLSFARPVQQVELLIEHSESSPEWRAFAQSETIISGRLDLTSAIQRIPGGLRIQHATPFNRIAIQDVSANPLTHWRVQGFRFKESTANIGNVAAETSVNPSAALIEDPPTQPATVTIQSVEAKSAPPGLDERGRIPHSNCRTEIFARPSTIGNAKYAPVRMHVSRSRREATIIEPPTPLTQSPVLHVPGPQILGFWRLNGRPDDFLRSSQRYTVREGAPGIVQFAPYAPTENPQRRYVTFNWRQSGGRIQGGALDIRGGSTFRDLGRHLHAELWVRPLPPSHGWSIYTLIDHDWRQSFWLGLRYGSGGFFIRLWLNGQSFESNRSIPAGEWSRVGFRYDGRTVRFYIDGAEVNGVAAELGPVRANPKGDLLRIGATLDADVNNLSVAAYPYLGSMMNLRIERNAYSAVSSATSGLLAAWPFDGNARDVKSGASKIAVGSVAFDQSHPESLVRRVALFDGTSWLRTANHAGFESTIDKLFVELWVNPDPGQTFPTLVCNGWSHSFWLGLAQAGAQAYRLRFWINGAVYQSSGVFPTERWTRVGAAYDGETVRFFIDGALSSVHPANHGPVSINPTRTIAVGASAYSSPTGAPEYPFRGRIADVRIWEATPALPSPAILVQSDADLPDFIDRGAPEGTYTYGLEPIDIFGRVASVIESRPVAVQDEFTPSPPAGIRAEFRPLSGKVSAAGADQITTDIRLPQGVTAADLIGYDLEVQTANSRGSVAREAFPILEAEQGSGTSFVVKENPFPRVHVSPGVDVAIHYDASLRVRWSWTGLQRLFTPRARAFRLYVRKGAFNRWEGAVAAVQAAGFNRFLIRVEPRLDVDSIGAVGRNCLVGPFMYTVEPPPSPEWDAVLRYNAAPVQAPRAGQLVQVNIPETSPHYEDPASTAAWERAVASVPITDGVLIERNGLTIASVVSGPEKEALRERGVDWITDDARICSLVIPDAGALSEAPRPSADEFVPGGLIAYDETERANEWKAFSVLWHDWESAGSIRIYFIHAGGAAPRLRDVRYCPGERYEQTLALADCPRLAADRGTLEVSAAVSTIDDRGAEGPLGDSAKAVAVNRRRPPTPPPPVITTIDRPDFHGDSRATLEWSLPADADWRGVSFQLYRATESDVASRDLEQRRSRSGAYRGLPPQDIFADDPDFAAWIVAMESRLGIAGLASAWPDLLFSPKPTRDRPQSEPPPGAPNRDLWEQWAAWDAATPIWQAWAERFYPALTSRQIVEVAERPGNEKAFTLVNDAPIGGNRHTDTLKGRVRNTWLYRLRSVSNALLPSAEWSGVSEPRATSVNAPPRAPVFTKIEAGDRQVTLHWTLDRGPTIKEYRVYRAERQEELEDLRHWSESSDPRMIAVVPDPLIRSIDRRLTLPGSLDVAEVLGVYRLGEFDFDSSDPGRQPSALNYFNPAPSSPAEGQSRFTPASDESQEHVIDNLRRIADGTPVVVVYSQSDGSESHLASLGAPPYSDNGLVGGRDYFYRLAAVDRLGQVSPGSKIVRSRPLELTKPPAPTLNVTRASATDGQDRVTVTCHVEGAQLEIVLRKRTSSDPRWITVVHWTPIDRSYDHTEDVPGHEFVEYQAYCRTPGNVVSDASRIVRTTPIIDLLGERA